MPEFLTGCRGAEMTKSQKKLWIGLIILALLTPLGIILPEKFKAGGAWGEWGPEALEKLIGYVPAGLRNWPIYGKPLSLTITSAAKELP